MRAWSPSRQALSLAPFRLLQISFADNGQEMGWLHRDRATAKKKPPHIGGRSMSSLSKAICHVYGRYLVCRHTLDRFITPAKDIGSNRAVSADSQSSQAARDALERSLAATLCLLFSNEHVIFIGNGFRLRDGL